MKTLGERLRRARDRKGYTQVYVKSKTGINNKTLSGYENNVSEPDLQSIKLLADIYEVTIDWLYGREVSMTQQNAISQEDDELLKGFNSLNENDQKYIVELMKRLKKEQN